jgi:hypothetical protein
MQYHRCACPIVMVFALYVFVPNSKHAIFLALSAHGERPVTARARIQRMPLGSSVPQCARRDGSRARVWGSRGLMRERETDRHVIDQRQDAERGLERNEARENERVSEQRAAPRTCNIDEMQRPKPRPVGGPLVLSALP